MLDFSRFENITFDCYGTLIDWESGIVQALKDQQSAQDNLTPAQIKLLETFADQAVIAIENVRLFQELKEALEQQTATSEILRVISQSQRDVQPVFETIAANARKLCEGTFGAVYTFDGDGPYA